MQAIEAVKDLTGLVQSLLGAPSQEIGEYLADKIRLFRYKNLLSIHDRVNQIRIERGQSGRASPLPTDVGIRLLEQASMASEPNLREMWSRLIANSTAPINPAPVRRVFVDTLGQMDSIDALLLEWLSSRAEDDGRSKHSVASITDGTKFTKEDILISLNNLSRLALIDISIVQFPAEVYVNSASSDSESRLTPMGTKLLELCH